MTFACQPEAPADGGRDGTTTDAPNVFEIQSARIPRITTVSPQMASNLGGTSLTITGKSFAPGAQVFVGGEPATFVNFISSTQLTAFSAKKTLPVGAVAVQVINSDGRSSERSDVLTLFNDNVALVPLRAATPLAGTIEYATADFNGDGLSDLLVGDGYSRLWVILAHGRGDYGDPQSLTIPSLMGYFRADAGDVNGDGKLDIIVGSGYGSTISLAVYLNHGDGTFATPVVSNLTTLSEYANSYLADVNGDGKTDVVIGGNSTSSYGLFALLGTSDGHFGTAVFSALTTFLGNGTFGDVNGDGKLDLLALSTSTNEVYFLAGIGDGRFNPPVSSGVDAIARQAVLGDWNGDGKLDLATLGAGGLLSIRSGRGDGSFSGGTLINVDANASGIDRGDVTGDGKLDLVIGRGEMSNLTGGLTPGAAWILAGNGDATFQTPRVLNIAPLAGADGVKVVDADKDGKLDVQLSSNYDATFMVLYGRGGGSFIEDVQLPAGITALAQADLNGDGKSDAVAVSVGANKLYVLLSNGDGTMAAPRAYDTDRGPSAVVIADVNGDGKADLLITNYDAATLSLLLGNGDGTFSPQRIFTVGAGANALIAQDMNGDGKLDVVTANYEASSVSVLLNSGGGSFASAKNYATGSGPAAVSGGDFNGDGRLDVVTANADSNSVSYLQGSAASAGALNAAKSTATGKSPNTISARDINGDGKLDVITGNGDSGDVSLLAGKGDGTFSAAAPLAQPGYVAEMAAADLSGDGRADLIVSGGSPGTVTLLYGFAGGIFSPSSRTLQTSGPLATLDMNGDGKLDLLVGQNSGFALLYLNTAK